MTDSVANEDKCIGNLGVCKYIFLFSVSLRVSHTWIEICSCVLCAHGDKCIGNLNVCKYTFLCCGFVRVSYTLIENLSCTLCANED